MRTDPIYRQDRPCYGESYSSPEKRGEHKGHLNAYDCYLQIWAPPPLPWVKRLTQINILAAPRYQASSVPRRSWHLALGIRHSSGDVQVYCNVGSGPGPFEWREKPTLTRQEEPGEWFCRRCVAEWTKEVHSVTVRVQGIQLKKGQLAQLLEKVGGTDLMEIELRPTDVEDRPALIASWKEGSGRNETTEVRYLLVGDGLVKL